MRTLRSLIRLIRPTHWAKNAFVLMPLPFAVAAGATVDATRLVLGLLGFCLVGSAAYALNDVWDAENDRLHPRKKMRPVAAGDLSPATALVASAVLLVAAAVLTRASGSSLALTIVASYALINLVYSLGAKNVALIDVFLLSSGFVLRVLFGCALMQVEPSNWLLLCSSMLSLFLALAKRRADLMRGIGESHRPSLGGYNVAFLDQMLAITAGMSVMAYALYCLEAEVLLPRREFASLPFVAYGVFEYLRLSQVREEGGSPTELLLSSPAVWFAGIGWAAATFWSLALP